MVPSVLHLSTLAFAGQYQVPNPAFASLAKQNFGAHPSQQQRAKDESEPVARYARLGRLLRKVTYTFEQTPLRKFGLSHLLVFEKQA
jgi:hypothetical protein